MFNLSNLALYVDSPNGFLEHYGATDHRLSSGDTGEKIAFACILGFAAIQGYCNQQSYSKSIDETLPGYQKEEDTDPPLLKRDLIAAGISAVYKAAVSSTSFVALSKGLFGFGVGASWSLAAICFPGNAFSQFAIFANRFEKKLNWHLSPQWRCGLSHTLAATYNIPNAALYFNAIDAFPKNINLLDHRLSKCDEPWEVAVVTVIGIFTAALLVSTQRSYSKKIADIFTNPEEVSQTEETSDRQTCQDKCRPLIYVASGMTAFYKTAVTSLSLVALIYAAFNSRDAGATIASLCSIGNIIANFSIFKPQQQRSDHDEEMGSESSETCCCGLFKTHVDSGKTAGLPLLNQPEFPLYS